MLSHDLRLGSAGHQVLLFLFRLIIINVPNRTVDHDVGVRSLCGRLDIRRPPASIRPLGTLCPLQTVIKGRSQYFCVGITWYFVFMAKTLNHLKNSWACYSVTGWMFVHYILKKILAVIYISKYYIYIYIYILRK